MVVTVGTVFGQHGPGGSQATTTDRFGAVVELPGRGCVDEGELSCHVHILPRGCDNDVGPGPVPSSVTIVQAFDSGPQRHGITDPANANPSVAG